MHLAQRKALFAMVDSLEHQIRYIKSILLMEDGDALVNQVKKPTNMPQAALEYLSQDEEEELEHAMEEDRKAALQGESDRIAKTWELQRKIIAEEASF